MSIQMQKLVQGGYKDQSIIFLYCKNHITEPKNYTKIIFDK